MQPLLVNSGDFKGTRSRKNPIFFNFDLFFCNFFFFHINILLLSNC